MNNTTRFKTFGIIAALIVIIGVGVVWFYPREHSSKVPHVKRDSLATQPKVTQPERSIASGTNDITGLQPTFKYANGAEGWGALSAILAREFKLTDEEVDQVMAILKVTRQRVDELMADQATIIKVNETTIRMETKVSDEQASKLEKETYTDIYKAIGIDMPNLNNDFLESCVKGEVLNFGRNRRTYTFTGAESGDDGAPLTPIATSPIINIIEETYAENSGSIRSTGRYVSYDGDFKEFKDRFGKMATEVLILAKNSH